MRWARARFLKTHPEREPVVVAWNLKNVYYRFTSDCYYYGFNYSYRDTSVRDRLGAWVSRGNELAKIFSLPGHGPRKVDGRRPYRFSISVSAVRASSSGGTVFSSFATVSGHRPSAIGLPCKSFHYCGASKRCSRDVYLFYLLIANKIDNVYCSRIVTDFLYTVLEIT